MSAAWADKVRDVGKEGTESKCKELVVPSAEDGHDLEYIAEYVAWDIAFDGIPVASFGNLLLLVINQIHYNFIWLCLFRVVCR